MPSPISASGSAAWPASWPSSSFTWAWIVTRIDGLIVRLAVSKQPEQRLEVRVVEHVAQRRAGLVEHGPAFADLLVRRYLEPKQEQRHR